MEINIEDVKKLREITGCGMLDCKKALERNDNNFDSALKHLNEKIDSDKNNPTILDYNRKPLG